jgi:hypothetical protein
MSYDYATNSIDVGIRPAWITVNRSDMTHAFAMLHHRIKWDVLARTITAVLQGRLDTHFINSLLSLSPSNTNTMVTDFKTAINQVNTAKKNGKADVANTHVTAIELVEQEIFSLPCNTYLGLNNRADDPGDTDDLDFTPEDIQADGSVTATALGTIQKAREKVFGYLLAASDGKKGLFKGAISDFRDTYAEHYGKLSTGTAFNKAHWHQDPPETLVYPGWRHWEHPLVKTPLTAVECRDHGT